jgi:hypothetical protein
MTRIEGKSAGRIADRIRAAAAWMRSHPDETMRSHPCLADLMGEAAAHIEKRASAERDELRLAIARYLDPLYFSDADERSPQSTKDLYARRRAIALRNAGEVLEIVARHQPSDKCGACGGTGALQGFMGLEAPCTSCDGSGRMTSDFYTNKTEE